MKNKIPLCLMIGEVLGLVFGWIVGLLTYSNYSLCIMIGSNIGMIFGVIAGMFVTYKGNKK